MLKYQNIDRVWGEIIGAQVAWLSLQQQQQQQQIGLLLLAAIRLEFDIARSAQSMLFQRQATPRAAASLTQDEVPRDEMKPILVAATAAATLDSP